MGHRPYRPTGFALRGAQFERATRVAYRRYQDLVGPRYGVRWIETLFVGDEPQATEGIVFELLRPTHYGPGQHAYPARHVTSVMSMLIEPAVYLPAMMSDVRAAGCRIVTRDFSDRLSLQSLPEPVIVWGAAMAWRPGLVRGRSSSGSPSTSAIRSPLTPATPGRETCRSRLQYPWGTSRYEESITHQAQDDHPEAASVAEEYRTTLALKDRTLVLESNVTFRSDRDNFYYDGVRRLLKDGALVREKVWKEVIPRDFQ